MTPERLEDLLQLWGQVNGAWGGNSPEERSLTGNSTLAGFGRPDGYRGTAEGRSGRKRRAMMAVAAGIRARIMPAEFVDHIPCTATRTYRAPDFDRRETADVDRVQAAWLVLYRTNAMHAELIRVQYQTKATQYEKADSLQIPLRQYKDEIKLARVWMMGQLSR